MHRSDKKRAILLVVIVVGVLMASMAFNNGCMRNPNPELQLTSYDDAVIVYNNAGEAYLKYYRAQTKEMQAELREEVGRYFLDAEDILKIWQKAESQGKPVYESVTLWTTVSIKIIEALSRYGIRIGD